MQNLKTPVLLCRRDGEVFYKNEAAKRWFRCPRIGAHLPRFMSGMTEEEAIAALEAVYDGRIECDMLPVYTESSYGRALAASFTYRSERCILLLFLPLLQLGTMNVNYQPLSDMLSANVKTILGRIRDLEEEERYADNAERASLRRVCGAEDKINDYFGKMLSMHDDTFPSYEMVTCIRMLRRVMQNVLESLGYRVTFALRGIQYLPNYSIPFLPLAIPYLSLALAALELSCDRSAHFRFSLDGTVARLEIAVKPKCGWDEPCSPTLFELAERERSMCMQLYTASSFEGCNGWHIGCRYEKEAGESLTLSLQKTIPDGFFTYAMFRHEHRFDVYNNAKDLCELAMAVFSLLQTDVLPSVPSGILEQTDPE